MTDRCRRRLSARPATVRPCRPAPCGACRPGCTVRAGEGCARRGRHADSRWPARTRTPLPRHPPGAAARVLCRRRSPAPDAAS